MTQRRTIAGCGACVACIVVLIASVGFRAAQAHVTSSSDREPPVPVVRNAASYVPEVSAPFLPYNEAWPVRCGRRAEELQGIIEPLDAKPSQLRTRRVGFGLSPGELERRLFAKLSANLPDDRALGMNLEGANSIVFQFDPTPKSRSLTNGYGLGIGPGPGAGPDYGFTFVFASIEREPDVHVEAKNQATLQRTWFAYYEPLGDEKSARDADGNALPKAVALLMPGVFGTPEFSLDPLTLKLRREGFGVLRMLCQPARFTERATIPIDRVNLGKSATAIGSMMNTRTAECAYAAEAAWAYVHERKPGVRSLPHAVLGLSGGAITLPAVVARSPSVYKAAVLIAGGVDFYLISDRSRYKSRIDAVDTPWIDGPPAWDELAAFDSRVLEIARLDSFHTAAAMKGITTLVMQGTVDTAVPSNLGDVLWERLGKPERWTYAMDHDFLCTLQLVGELDRVMNWLNAAVGSSPKLPASKLEPEPTR